MTTEIGYIVIASVGTKVRLPLEKAISIFTKYGFQDQLPKNRKLSDIWERCTNVKATFRNDVALSQAHAGKRVRFYTSKVKGSLGGDGQLTRHLVMEVVDPSVKLETKFDVLEETKQLADNQRVNFPLAIMKYDDHDFQKHFRFYWAEEDARNGYGYLQDGEAAKVIAEIKERIKIESGSLGGKEIWKAVIGILDYLGSYSLTARGSTYFVPTGNGTKKTLKGLMDLINDLSEGLSRSSCTIWEVTKNPEGDYFGSASEVIASSLLELDDRIAKFANDVTKKNKREKTLKAEWAEIQKHIVLFKNILGNKLGEIESGLKNAADGIMMSQYHFDTSDSVVEVLDSFDDLEIDVPELELVDDKVTPQVKKADDFEIEIDF